MRASVGGSIRVLALAAACLAATGSHAQESRSADPWKQFRSGFELYNKGDKGGALAAYSKAAESGHAGARWKIACMYAQGDGTQRDDYHAFQLFQSLVEEGAAAGTPDESFIADAVYRLGRYYRFGIEGSPVRPDRSAAEQMFMRAASMYGHTGAQYEIGDMLLHDDHDAIRAARWLQLAADKGHIGAKAKLGDLLFQNGRTVEGLALLTTASEHADVADRTWIVQRQEEAFALATEAERRLAYDMVRHEAGELVVSVD